MVERRVVYNCDNANKTEHALHEFPKEEGLRRQWVRFVSVKRANFKPVTRNSLAVDCRVRSLFFAAVLQHGSLVGGRIVRRGTEAETGFVAWQCPDNTASVSRCGRPTEKMQSHLTQSIQPLPDNIQGVVLQTAVKCLTDRGTQLTTLKPVKTYTKC